MSTSGPMTVTIDEYSLAALPIEMYFNTTFLSIGTAFVWKSEGRLYLITNWHNVSGKDPNTGKHISKTATEPNNLKVGFNQKGNMGHRVAKTIRIRDQNDAPVWFVHPQHGNKVDVVALPFDPMPDVDEYAINGMSSNALAVNVGIAALAKWGLQSLRRCDRVRKSTLGSEDSRLGRVQF